MVSDASIKAILEAQVAFSGSAEEMSIFNEEDVQILVDEVRHGRKD